MRALLRFFKLKYAEAATSTRRVMRPGDPAIGLEYNGINANHYVSRKIWKVDIARTPQVVRSLGDRIDVHGEAWIANKYNPMLNYKASKCHGRGR